MSRYPAIPEFANTPESMATSLRAMKMILEQLTSARQGQATVALVFVQPFAPGVDQNPGYGSLWINPETNAEHWWDGNTWKQVVGSGSPGAAGSPGVGVPVGGTTGQALVKASNADYHTEWFTIPGLSAKWIDYAVSYSSLPVQLLSDASGQVFEYRYNNDTYTLYRFIATDGSVDGFYTSFNGSVTSGLVVSKEATV